MRTTRDMSDRHERRLAEVLGGRVTRGSGCTPRDPADGKHRHGSGRFLFCWDGKSSLGASIGVTRAMWAKIVEQSHWARPMLGLLWFSDERGGVETSLVVVRDDDFAELLEAADAGDQARRYLETVAYSADSVYPDRDVISGREDLVDDLRDILSGGEPSRALHIREPVGCRMCGALAGEPHGSKGKRCALR